MAASTGVTASQLRAGRALLKMEQQELCRLSGVSIATLRRMEGTDGNVRGNYENVIAVQRVLEAGGVQFIPENGGGAGVRLRDRSTEPVKEPKGPATEVVQKMDHAIATDRQKAKKRT